MDIFTGATLDLSATGVIVAVIDSGVAYNHPDLINQMWDGTNCKDENGNFLGGCKHGYDYEDGDNDPLPTSASHGTHVSGTIAAELNNTNGLVGVNPNAKIMAIKTKFTSVEIVNSIHFAKENGARIINASFAGFDTNCADIFDRAYYDAIKEFPGLFIAGAGNNAELHDGETFFGRAADY